MTNDLNTLNGSLQQMIDELEENLQSRGVDAEYDSITGIRGLIAQITDIEASVGGIDVITKLSVNLSETSIIYGDSIVISGVLEADKDDTSQANVDLEGYLKGATINIYHDETLIGTAITNGVGEYSFNYTNISIGGTNNIYCVFEGTDDYQECTSTAIPLTVNNDLIVTATKDILSYADNDSTILTATLIGGDVEGKNVVFKNGDTVLDTIQTDSNGIAEYEYTSQGVGDVIFTIECSNLTKTYDISDYYLYDPVTSDKSYLYDTAHQKTTYGSNANVSLTYDSTNNYYIISNSTANSTGFIPINALTGLDNIIIEADVYINHNNTGVNLGFGLFEPSTGNNCQIFNIGNSNYPIDIFEGTDHLSTGTTTRNVWSKLIIEIRNKQLLVVLKNANGTTNVSTTYTMSLTRSNNTLFGISMYDNNNTLNAFLKNIKIKPIKTILIDVDTPILSFVDSTEENPQIATLTATLNPIAQDKTVKIYQDDVLVATETTSSQGQVSYEYESQGVGDVTFTVECMNLTKTFAITDAWKYVSSGSYTGTSSTISFQEIYESSAYDNIEISATIKAPNKGFSLAFLKSNDSSSSIQDNIFTIGVDGGNYLTVARIENGSSTVYTSDLFQQYTANSDLNCVIRIENGVVTLKINSYTYTSTPITGLKYVGVRNWNNAKTVQYSDLIVKPL